MNIKGIKQLGGTSGNTFMIRTGKKDYVLKLYSKKDLNKVKYQMDILKKLNMEGRITIDPINDEPLRVGGKVGFIYEFVDGKHYRELRIKNKLLRFSQFVGRFSKVASRIGLNRMGGDRWVRHETRIFTQWAKKLDKRNDRYYQNLSKLIKSGLPLVEKDLNGKTFRTQVIHGDLHHDNVIYDKKSGLLLIIDTDGLEEGILAREILVPISYELTSSPSKNKKIITESLKGYESETKLTRKEKEAIPALMLLRKFGEIVWLIMQNENGNITNDLSKRAMAGTVKQLRIVLSQYENLKKDCLAN